MPVWLVFSDILGWCYFIAWSVSFYPQVFVNWKRGSVVGFSIDFLVLNIQGFTCYSIFNLVLFCSSSIKSEYSEYHHTTEIPVQVNDIVFALHALALCIILAIQVSIYEKGTQRIHKLTIFASGILWFGLAVVALLCATHVLGMWLWLIESFGYFKMAITIIKYSPQVYLNYRRKCTVGWAIGGVLLDLIGGILSFLQMFIISINKNDWTPFTGNITKVGLAIFSILFDIIFMCQHYVLYKGRDAPEHGSIKAFDPFDHDPNYDEDKGGNIQYLGAQLLKNHAIQ